MRRGRETPLRGVVTLPLSGNASGIYMPAPEKTREEGKDDDYQV
jgi:hypothetical protein